MIFSSYNPILLRYLSKINNKHNGTNQLEQSSHKWVPRAQVCSLGITTLSPKHLSIISIPACPFCCVFTLRTMVSLSYWAKCCAFVPIFLCCELPSHFVFMYVIHVQYLYMNIFLASPRLIFLHIKMDVKSMPTIRFVVFNFFSNMHTSVKHLRLVNHVFAVLSHNTLRIIPKPCIAYS